MNRSLAITFVCLFLVMLGFSVTLAVLPSRIGRVAGSREVVALHVGVLTGAYAVAQFIAAPQWGRWSDRHGRRTATLFSLGGFALSQVLFALATSLPFLYAARVLGGLFAAAMFPIAAAYVADTLPERRQAQGMAWLSASAALGVVAGPVLGGLSTQQAWHWDTALGHVAVHGFAAPFLALAAMSGIMIIIALRWQLESSNRHEDDMGEGVDGWMVVGRRIRGLLTLVVASQVAMALFMTAFALYADARLNLGPRGIGAAFALCGLITATVQVGAIWLLVRRWGEWTQIGMGFGAMGVGLAAIPLAPSLPLLMVAVGVFVVGSAVVAPSLLSLSAKQTPHSVGTAAGLLGSATYLGQAIGPFAASALFLWADAAPFYATAAVMLTAAVWIIRSTKQDEQEATR